MQRIPFQVLQDEYIRVLLKTGFAPERAALVARRFTENQRDGVYSHGLHRFPSFFASIRANGIDIHATPVKAGGLGAIEQWDGNMGVGLWNAHVVMGRAVELARTHGMGCVALRNTNHWMRAGAYALQATEAGCVGICWTNTIPLLPPWGSAGVRIGNNPLAIAVPPAERPMLLDMAMSQYSNGKLEVLHQRGQKLPLAGGYDAEGTLTRDPGAILAARRAVPIGYWKGSALAVMLDTLAALLSGGLSSHQIARLGSERSVSQVFIAIDVMALSGESALADLVKSVVDDLHQATPLSKDEAVRYPGEGMIRIREESQKIGVLVEETQWAALRAM